MARPWPHRRHRWDLLGRLGSAFVTAVTDLDRYLLVSTWRTIAASVVIFASAVAATWLLMPKAEYLPEGNRNLVFGILLPPPGYNMDELLRLADIVEARLVPYWDVDPGTPEARAARRPGAR